MEPTSISVIIPVYNEESTLPVLLPQLPELLGQCELIFVDGKSEDNSVPLIRQWIQQQNTGEKMQQQNDKDRVQLLFSSKGRAAQMNLGAQHSHGEVLFFLHCDSILPKHPLEQIRQVMEKYRLGCFGVGFHSRNFFMLTNRIISNHRAKYRHLIFGDQGMFIRRELFFEAGMFPDIPLMEDYQFSLTLREKGEPVGFAKNRIFTSDRRYPKGTVNKLKVMWQMNRLRKMYREGKPVEEIAALYGDIR